MRLFLVFGKGESEEPGGDKFGVGGVAADSTAALAFGGAHPTVTTATEEWSSTSNSTKTISTD